MPRKKAVKKVTAKKPMLPDGDEGSKLTQEEKMRKLDVFLKDLETKAEKFRKEIESDQEKLFRVIERAYTLEITKLPSSIRKMKFKDLIDCGGTYEDALKKIEADTEKENDTVLSTMSASSLRTVKRTRIASDNTGVPETILEEAQSTIARLKNLPLNKKPGLKTPMNQFKTPMHKPLQQLGWETPLITPKFDPRLPVTPAQMRRCVDSKEVLMSLGGSPVKNTLNEFNEMFKTEIDMEELSNLSTTKEKIACMMAQLKMAMRKADEEDS